MAAFPMRLLAAVVAIVIAVPGCADAPRREARGAMNEKPVTLGAKPVRLTLKSAALSSKVDALRSGNRLFLVIRGLHADRQPGVTFDVYLDLPAAATPAQRESHYAGNIHFFNAVIGNRGNPRAAAFTLDITELARTLRSRGLLRNATTITIEPSEGAPSGTPVIDHIELVARPASP